MTGSLATVPTQAPSLQPEREASGHRLRAVDAVRGIAAIAVVFSHSFEQALRFMTPGTGAYTLISALFVDYLNFGRIGVVGFFVLSGFVIPFSFSHRDPVRSFLVARLFRLYPAYWVSLAGAVLLALALVGTVPPGKAIAANLTMIQSVLGQPNLIGVYWTLFYELVFYAACLAAFLMGRMTDPRYLLGVVAVLSAAGLVAAGMRHGGHMAGVPIGLPMFLAIMHFGTLVRLHDRGDGPLATRCYRLALAIVLATAGPISAIGFIQHATGERLIADVTGLYAGLALFLLLRRRSGIARKGLLFLGLISYSLYLFHPLCLDASVAIAGGLAPRIAPLFVIFSVPASSIVLAAIVQRFVEAPCNIAGKRMRDRLRAA